MQYDRQRILFPALEWSICYRHSFISSVGSLPLKGNQRSLAEGKSNCARGGDCVVLYLLLSPFISLYLLLLITDPTPAPPLQGRGTEVRWQREKQLLGMCQTVYTNKKNGVPSKFFPLYLMMKQVKRSVAAERHLFRVGLSRHFQRRYRDTSTG